MYNKILNKILKILLKVFYGFLAIIALIYLGVGAILFYIGPWETRTVKQNLRTNPVDIVVSLTTTPYRIDKIKPVLDSILRQSIKPTRIYVNVPYRFKRNNAEYVIPDWLKNYPNIIINRTKDYGPGTKLIATLEKEHDPNTIIITVDDDKYYPRHAIRDLAKQYLPGTYKINNKMGSAITGLGVNFIFAPHFDLYGTPVFLGDRPSLLVVGAYGVAYKRGFFKDDIFSLMEDLPLSCFLSDDLMISAYLLSHGVNIIKISGTAYNLLFIRLLFKELPSASTVDALSYGANGLATGSNETNYGHCLEVLPAHNKNIYRQVIVERSALLNELPKKEIFKVGIVQFFYYRYLYDVIGFFPFIRELVLATVG